MLFIRQSQRAVAAFLFSVALAVAAGGVCVAFGPGAIPMLVPAHAATDVATQSAPATPQNSLPQAGTALQPVPSSPAGT